MKCRFCDDEALAIFHFSRGCVCYPDDRQQTLCWQHVVRATPLGGMELIEDLTLGQNFTTWWRKWTRRSLDDSHKETGLPTITQSYTV